jgi:O-antigen/teichoic acid export membrane protein
MFEYFVYALLLFLLGVSLFIQPVLAWFAPPTYAGAGGLVPVVCLSFVFFSLDEHFRVPALLAKRTLNLIPAYAIGAAANIVLNVAFVPRFGAMAAAWASVATYAIFAGVGLVQCRKIERFDYPLTKCALVLGAMILSFIVCQYVQALGAAWSLAAPAVVWIGWTIGLVYSTAWQQFRIPRLADLTP